MFFYKSALLLLVLAAAVLAERTCQFAEEAEAVRPAAFCYAGGPCATCPVTFQHTPQPATIYTWRFGDHTSARQGAGQFTHTYARPGVYRVLLTAQSPAGTDTASQRICVGTARAH